VGTLISSHLQGLDAKNFRGHVVKHRIMKRGVAGSNPVCERVYVQEKFNLLIDKISQLLPELLADSCAFKHKNIHKIK
jgi:hypothetical protein